MTRCQASIGSWGGELQSSTHDEWSSLRDRDAGEAVAAAYRAHAHVVRLRACAICGPDLAGDVVQEVFLRLWRAPHRFDPTRATLRTYLLVLASGVSIDLVRADRRRRSRDERAMSASVVSIAADHGMLEPLLADEAGRRVRLALTHLPDGHRSAIESVHLDGFTFAEAAMTSGIPEGTIKSRVRTGLHLLRPLLADLDNRADQDDAEPLQRPVPAAEPRPSKRRRRRERLAAAIGRSNEWIEAPEPIRGRSRTTGLAG